MSQSTGGLTGRLRRSVKAAAYQLGLARYCPICQLYTRRFGTFGDPPRANVQCPFCNSLERHRIAWQFLKTRTNLFDGQRKRFLHIAAEPIFERLLRQVPSLDYLTADLYDERAMEKMDITDIQRPDNSFDVIFCSHVLEHVPDDRQAMREFRRVLAPGGFALLMVPVTAQETFEDPSVTDPAERHRLFGQHDHVRRYGPDFEDRLREAGFQVAAVPGSEVVGPRNVVGVGVEGNDTVYYCTKGQ